MSSLLGRKQSQESPQKGRTGLLSRLDERQPTAASDKQTDIKPASKASKEAEARRLEKIREIRNLVQDKALAEVKKDLGKSDPTNIRPLIESIFKTVLSEGNYLLNRRERIELFEEIVNLLMGFGQIEKLLADEYTTDIMIVGGSRVFVERKGRVFQTDIMFDSEEEVVRIIERIVAPLGRRIDEASPMVDARMPDGSRINAVIRPVALDGPTLTIRKFAKVPLSMTDLVSFETATPEVFEFLSACVLAGANILVSGGSGSGKTTLLNVLSGAIPDDERIVTIENAAELELVQPHVIRLESRPPNIEEEGEITIQELVINSLRMRPDRIVIGEVRSGEAVDMLQAMNSGSKTMGTIHANAPIDALSRLEVMCLMAGLNMPIRAIREQISATVDLIVHMSRMRDGSRRIVAISEVTGMEGDRITLSDLFAWEQTGLDGDGKILGTIDATGLEPQRLTHLFDAAGIHLPPSLFISSRPAVIEHHASTEPSAPAEPEYVDYAPPDEVPGVQEEAGYADMGEAKYPGMGEFDRTDDSYP